jgi:hypothetical protein
MRRTNSAQMLHHDRQPIWEYAYAGHNSAAHAIGACSNSMEYNTRGSFSRVPPECEKKLTNGNSPQQYVSAMRLLCTCQAAVKSSPLPPFAIYFFEIWVISWTWNWGIASSGGVLGY